MGIGRGSSPCRSRSPGGSAVRPGALLAGQPRPPGAPTPQGRARCPGRVPSPRRTPGRQGAAWLCDLPRAARGASRAPARASSRARAGGAGGGRAAMVAGLGRSGSRCPVASAHHSTRAADPRGFALGGVSSEPLAAPASSARLSDFEKVPRVRARRRHEPLTVAGAERAVRLGPGPGVARERARACATEPRPAAPSHPHGTNDGLPAPPAGGVPRVLETARGPGQVPPPPLAHPRGGPAAQTWPERAPPRPGMMWPRAPAPGCQERAHAAAGPAFPGSAAGKDDSAAPSPPGASREQNAGLR